MLSGIVLTRGEIDPGVMDLFALTSCGPSDSLGWLLDLGQAG